MCACGCTRATSFRWGRAATYSLLDAGRRLGSTYGHGSSLWSGDDARAFAHIYATAGVLAQSVTQDGQD